MSIHVVLHEPEIPQNTGNIARTCAATGAVLHLIEPLGFSLEDRYLRRAGLDYWPMVDLRLHSSWDAFLEEERPSSLFLLSTRGTRSYHTCSFPDETYLVFGKETAGLPPRILEAFPDRVVRIPMRAGARSLNLSNAVAILVYEALRVQGFPGLV
ncbi:RNA methyltransferase, TrmH family, group 2 [Spirochaeta thermophila DSM 6578]|uniref:Putative tRNA (cytidine(34)-2'-O)-methyltransferase n=1 Tax=Winmispira thermophila (strain ATCC 700085 / DSM 6578 / Z-1203) TaxID=869211 RepID=G0GEA7_WINT7|nr:tRNA (uridine(34)/cytosine(34)/5-carboxymethylaminomethyluridine(34)-2'-O)-methyltransferase TrmL [Spirochaeta thermophila]AEJ62244.1 RNA methyltransferase, TrmH family, group 2 [Spirochaeta thermophila DSM 6578]